MSNDWGFVKLFGGQERLWLVVVYVLISDFLVYSALFHDIHQSNGDFSVMYFDFLLTQVGAKAFYFAGT